jgi:hypothetical protein
VVAARRGDRAARTLFRIELQQRVEDAARLNEPLT